MILALGYSTLLLLPNGGPAFQLSNGWGVVAAGCFFFLVLGARWRAPDAAIVAALVATFAVMGWMAAFRLHYAEVATDALRPIWAFLRYLGDRTPEARDIFAAYAEAMTDASDLFPAGVVVTGIAGMLLAYRWYHILVPDALGIAPGRFREFRFNDHLVWFLVLAVVGGVAQFAGWIGGEPVWPLCLLAVAGALYAARGLAVIVHVVTSRPASVLLLLPLLVLALFQWPFLPALCFGAGLADTWLDFRRPRAAPPGD